MNTGDGPIRLLVLDKNALFRASLGCFLAAAPGFEIVGVCGSTSEAAQILKTSRVDVVLLDFALGGERGIEFLSAARQSGYEGRFLIVAGEVDARDAAIALKLGASGIFLKSDMPENLIQAIRLIASGDTWVDRIIIQLLADRVVDPPREPREKDTANWLVDREQKVLLGIMGGLSNRKIGQNISLSESSVKSVVQRLFARAGVRTRSQLVRAALEGSIPAPRVQEASEQSNG